MKLPPVVKTKMKSMPPASWRNLGSSAPIPRSKLESQSLGTKQVVLSESGSGRGFHPRGMSMSTPELGKKRGDDTGTRPGTESTRPGTQGGLSTRPASHDGFRPGPTLEEHQTGVPEADTQ